MRPLRTLTSILFCILFATTLNAQTLAQAQKLYQDEDYEQAMPVFAKYVKQQPNNGNYNLWYGVCLMRTGSAREALPYLKKALQRKATNAQLMLAQCEDALFYYEDAVDDYEAYIADLAKRKKTSQEAEQLLEEARKRLRLLRGVEKVVILDSISLPKDRFLEAYELSRESGSIRPIRQALSISGSPDGTAYQSEIGNQIFYSQMSPNDSIYRIYSADRQGDGWSTAKALPEEVNDGSDAAYPFMMPDGSTFYFASKGDRSIGGYDIFVTRYDSSEGTFFDPENVGMPFNSIYNDYMMAIDELNNLGWFASDRFHEGDSVTVYVFVPNESKNVYSLEDTDKDDLASKALIRDYKDSWNDQEETAKEGMQRLTALRQGSGQASSDSASKKDLFIINDDITISSAQELRSQQARSHYEELLQARVSYQQFLGNLENLRNQYAKGAGASLKAEIEDAERMESVLYEQISFLERQIRKEELSGR